MEAWTCWFCRHATLRRRPGPGGANRRQPTWPLAARKQPRAYQGTAKQLLRFTRPGFRRGTAVRIIRRTAVYGPVRTVVWEDRKSTRLNSSHQIISYAVFCFKKKKITLDPINKMD